MFRNNIFSTLQLFVVPMNKRPGILQMPYRKTCHPKFLFSWRTKDNEKVEKTIYEFCKQVLNIPDAHRLIADYTIVSEDQDNNNPHGVTSLSSHAIQALFIAQI
ncbi:hypothetical protein [Enterococcus faecium]|uniref:hypothetical protein n=1 Tax=Enterococcus faecium TaxID=1352 RepID=UPI00387E6E19